MMLVQHEVAKVPDPHEVKIMPFVTREEPALMLLGERKDSRRRLVRLLSGITKLDPLDHRARSTWA